MKTLQYLLLGLICFTLFASKYENLPADVSVGILIARSNKDWKKLLHYFDKIEKEGKFYKTFYKFPELSHDCCEWNDPTWFFRKVMFSNDNPNKVTLYIPNVAYNENNHGAYIELRKWMERKEKKIGIDLCNNFSYKRSSEKYHPEHKVNFVFEKAKVFIIDNNTIVIIVNRPKEHGYKNPIVDPVILPMQGN